MLSLLGLITAIWADKFDNIASITNFIIVPLSFLSGTFYSIDRLPEFWRGLATLNPFFYMIDGFRAGFIGASDASILTGVILEVSRTAGETAPIMFTGAAFFLPFMPQSVFDQTMALSLHLFVVTTQVPGVPEQLPYGVALVLIGIVLVMNSVSIAFRYYLRGQKKW